MYCIDTGAIAFMFILRLHYSSNGDQNWQGISMLLYIFDILGGKGSSRAEKGTPLLKIRDPWWEKTSLLYQKSGGPRH